MKSDKSMIERYESILKDPRLSPDESIARSMAEIESLEDEIELLKGELEALGDDAKSLLIDGGDEDLVVRLYDLIYPTGKCDEGSNLFYEGAVPVKFYGKWGYIDRTGAWIIEPKFDKAWDFQEGKAAVMVKGKWGYIDNTGALIIEPKFDNAYYFQEGMAQVIIKGKCGYIDSTGALIIEPKFDNFFNFHEGIASVMIEGKWGYIDKTGEWIIEPKFDNAYYFQAGKAAVMVKGKWGYIDNTGAWIIAPKFDEVFDFQEGKAAVKIKDKWGYIDNTSAWIIEPKFDKAFYFQEGRALVMIKDKWGYIDKTGAWIIEPKYDELLSYYDEGLIAACVNGKWGYIDDSENWIIEPKFDYAGRFREGVAMVEFFGKYGYIDKSGKWIVEPIIENLYSCKDEITNFVVKTYKNIPYSIKGLYRTHIEKVLEDKQYRVEQVREYKNKCIKTIFVSLCKIYARQKDDLSAREALSLLKDYYIENNETNTVKSAVAYFVAEYWMNVQASSDVPLASSAVLDSLNDNEPEAIDAMIKLLVFAEDLKLKIALSAGFLGSESLCGILYGK